LGRATREEQGHKGTRMDIAQTKPHRILGIDPGLNITGYGVLELRGPSILLLEAGVVRGGRRSLEGRLGEIHRGVIEVLSAYEPTFVALEELYSHYERPRTAILMGHARGVICLAAQQSGAELRHYAATRVKKMLTGSGRAPKGQVQAAICQEFRLAAPPEPPDVADALAVGPLSLLLSASGSGFGNSLK
jgi:crossover junction endodeoxyribonuclease RuvC